MEFVCVNCGDSRQLSDTAYGKRIKCATCGVVQQLPGRPENVPTNVASPGAVVSKQEQQSTSQGSKETSDPSRLRDSDEAESNIDFGVSADVSAGIAENATSSTRIHSSVTQKPNNRDSLQLQPSAVPQKHSQTLQVKDYKVNRTVLGTSVAYACPRCGERLINPVREAGGIDNCPKCRQSFVVPGANEYQQQLANEAIASSVRKAQADELTEANRKGVINRVTEAGIKAKDIQLDRDPFKEWVIYLAIMIVLMVIAAGRYLVAAVTQDSSYLCIVIIALFFIGLVLNFGAIMRLRNEYVCAAVCMNNLHKPNGLMLVTKGPAAGVLHQHVIDLESISRHDESFTQDSLVTLLYSRMMARSKIVEVLGAVLVTLGLIGTIVGLIQMTDGLSVTLSSLDSKQQSTELLSGMRSTMSGLGTAFNTTLVGALLGSVLLRILNTVYTSNVDHLVTYVASTAEVSIVPRLKRERKLAAQLNSEAL